VEEIAFAVERGAREVWEVRNSPISMPHPMHLHGFFFQVLDEHGSPAKPMAWKDTVNIPFDQTVRFIVRFDERGCGMSDRQQGQQRQERSHAQRRGQMRLTLASASATLVCSPISILAIWLRCTSSGPSAKRSVRAWA